jgi:hypothetical protein
MAPISGRRQATQTVSAAGTAGRRKTKLEVVCGCLQRIGRHNAYST